MKKGQVDIITMGCSKNLVDSEALLTKFEQAGYHCTHDAKRIEGEIVVVNTCGFIEDAKQESIDTILELVQAKEEGRISKLFVMGCLSQRYQEELEKEIPQVDKYYGKFNFMQLLSDLGNDCLSLVHRHLRNDLLCLFRSFNCFIHVRKYAFFSRYIGRNLHFSYHFLYDVLYHFFIYRHANTSSKISLP